MRGGVLCCRCDVGVDAEDAFETDDVAETTVTDDVAETTVSELSFEISKWYRDLQCNWFIGSNEFTESVEVARADSTVLNEEGDCD